MVKEFEIPRIVELTTLRDLTYEGGGLVKNPIFEQGFVAWEVVNCVLDTSVIKYGSQSARLNYTSPASYLKQFFPIPLGTDWFTEFYFYACGTIGEKIHTILTYTDGAVKHEDHTFTTGFWEKFLLAMDANKYIEHMLYNNPSFSDDCWLDGIFTVF